MHTIKLWRNGQGWMATDSDPTVRELFGTDTLPCAFTAHAEAELVRTRIQALNPDKRVVVLECIVPYGDSQGVRSCTV